MRLFIVLALLMAGGTPLGQQRSAAQLSKAGWDALDSGRIQEAAAAFDEALKIAPQQASSLLGAGVAARLQGREDEARRFLVDALKIEPALTAASLLLGNVLYQAGDIDVSRPSHMRPITRN